MKAVRKKKWLSAWGYLLTLAILAVGGGLRAQEGGCGFRVTAEQLRYMEKHRTLERSFDPLQTRGVVDIPIQLHLVSKGDGTGAVTMPEVTSAIEHLNSLYIEANIRFVVLKYINEIKKNEYYDFDVANEEALAKEYDVQNVLNLYVVNTISNGASSLCGYAYFPPGNDRVIMSRYCLNNNSTLAHEIGHYFMLFHTHGLTNTGGTTELVDGTNCSEHGDKVCDTPADPNLSGKVNDACVYIGTEKDQAGKPYAPDAQNMMSYAPKECRKHFTGGQYARISYAVEHHRNYLRFPPEELLEPLLGYSGRLSGSLSLEIEGQRIQADLSYNLFKAVESYQTGTNFQLFITNNEPAFIYVIGSNVLRESNLLFPMENRSAFLKKGESRFVLPDRDYMYQLDETLGKDYFCVLYSKQPIDVKKVIENLKGYSGTFMQRLYKSLGNEVIPTNLVEYESKEGILFFKSLATNYSIVPIVLELPHN